MKPIDEQNAVLLVLRRAPATPNKMVSDLRASGLAIAFNQVGRALDRLEVDGLVHVTGEMQETGSEPRPFYQLTPAGHDEAEQLPEGN